MASASLPFVTAAMLIEFNAGSSYIIPLELANEMASSSIAKSV
jgi:hypothetical protein